MRNSSTFTEAVAALDAGDLSFFRSGSGAVGMDERDAEGGWTLLHYASSHGRTEFVRHFLEHGGADPNQADAFGQTPLHAAAMANDLLSLQLLLDHSAEPVVYDQQHKSPLNLATMHGSVACAKCLLPLFHQAPGELSNPHFQAVLVEAVIHGQLELLELYINAGMDSGVSDENGYDLVHLAIFEEQPAILSYLIGIGMRPQPLPEHDGRELKDVVRSKRVGRILAELEGQG